jgi:hypothetical protein
VFLQIPRLSSISCICIAAIPLPIPHLSRCSYFSSPISVLFVCVLCATIATLCVEFLRLVFHFCRAVRCSGLGSANELAQARCQFLNEVYTSSTTTLRASARFLQAIRRVARWHLSSGKLGVARLRRSGDLFLPASSPWNSSRKQALTSLLASGRDGALGVVLLSS